MFILYISEFSNFLSLNLIASTILVVSTISHSTDHMIESFHRHTITKLSGEVLVHKTLFTSLVYPMTLHIKRSL